MGSITLGTIFSNGITLTALFAAASIAVFGITGLWMAYSAFSDLANLPRRAAGTPGNAAWIAKLFGSVMCFSIPQAAGVSWISLFSASTPMQMIGEQASGVGAPTNCLAQSSAAGANPVACVLGNLSRDTAPVFDLLIMTVAAVAGLWMLFKFVRSVVDKSNGNPQASIKWGSLVVGIVFLGVGAFIHIIGVSLGIAGNLLNSSGYANTAAYLSYMPSGLGMSPQYTEMLAAAYGILASVGFYEVIHGGFILATALNPNPPAGMGGKASMHMIFGTLLVFLPLVVQAFVASGMGGG